MRAGNQRKHANSWRLFGQTDQRQRSVLLQQAEVRLQVVRCRAVSRIKSNVLACAFIALASVETTTSFAPNFSASSFFLSDVVSCTVCAPKECAN